MGRYEEVVAEWCEIAGNHEQLDTLKVMELWRLDRIAESLAEINDHLSDLSEAMRDVSELLERCENVGPGGSMLAISGIVETI